uniref:7TM_GPCR_Srx domain-containing protein n=1 Tax=Heterorhabditis bacteriophora TaxID=37862 RepID=A0A1I7X279_HETBA
MYNMINYIYIYIYTHIYIYIDVVVSITISFFLKKIFYASIFFIIIYSIEQIVNAVLVPNCVFLFILWEYIILNKNMRN